ncbi:hypothetical protein ACQ4WX_50820 [Streptomyces lasalocidi]
MRAAVCLPAVGKGFDQEKTASPECSVREVTLFGQSAGGVMHGHVQALFIPGEDELRGCRQTADWRSPGMLSGPRRPPSRCAGSLTRCLLRPGPATTA